MSEIDTDGVVDYALLTLAAVTVILAIRLIASIFF